MEGLVISALDIIIIWCFWGKKMPFKYSGAVFNGVRGVSLLNMYVILKDNFCLNVKKY